MQFGQDPLGLAEGITKEHRGALGAGLPPVADFGGHLGTGRPAVDRQAEGGLADQHIGAHRLKRRTAGVGIALEVAADQPALAAGLEADLGGAEHVAGAVERQPGVLKLELIAVVEAVQFNALPQSLAQNSGAGAVRPVGAAARPGVVGVAVGDQGAGHRPPGIDPGVGSTAVETLGGEADQAVAGQHRRRFRRSSPASVRSGPEPAGAGFPPAQCRVRADRGSARASPAC